MVIYVCCTKLSRELVKEIDNIEKYDYGFYADWHWVQTFYLPTEKIKDLESKKEDWNNDNNLSGFLTFDINPENYSESAVFKKCISCF